MKTRRMFLIALCGVAMLIGTSSCKKEKQENEDVDDYDSDSDETNDDFEE